MVTVLLVALFVIVVSAPTVLEVNALRTVHDLTSDLSLIPRRRPTLAQNSSKSVDVFKKALYLNSKVIIYGDPYPQLDELAANGLTAVGTNFETGYGEREFSTIRAWIQKARQSGFPTFVMFGVSYQSTQSFVGTAINMGVDAIVIDEPYSQRDFTQSQLLSVLDKALKLNPGIILIIDEYNPRVIAMVYASTAAYPSVYVASDDYYDLATIDYNISAAAEYQKTPLVWLIFSQGSDPSFPCYKDLSTWIAYAKARNVYTLFYRVDCANAAGPGSWTLQWSLVASY